MGLFDNMIKGAAANAVNGAVNKAVNSAVSAAQSKTEKFTFTAIPANSAQLMALPEASLDTPYKTAALAILSLLMYEANPDTCFEMLDALRGPDPLSNQAKGFIRERLNGKAYLVKSFFAGATVQNGYTPSEPLVIEVSSNPNSFTEENWATIYVKSAGADSPRPLRLRRKPSTNQWFINDIMCLSDIRVPASADPWA